MQSSVQSPLPILLNKWSSISRQDSAGPVHWLQFKPKGNLRKRVCQCLLTTGYSSTITMGMAVRVGVGAEQSLGPQICHCRVFASFTAQNASSCSAMQLQCYPAMLVSLTPSKLHHFEGFLKGKMDLPLPPTDTFPMFSHLPSSVEQQWPLPLLLYLFGDPSLALSAVEIKAKINNIRPKCRTYSTCKSSIHI